MRVPKFKAWDKETSSLRNVLVIDWLNGLVDLSGGITEREFDDVVLVQSTGLKDKNGREIYEGDIVKYISSNEVEHFLEIKWNSVDAQFDFGWVITRYARNGEIVGNVFENPELLEVQHG